MVIITAGNLTVQVIARGRTNGANGGWVIYLLKVKGGGKKILIYLVYQAVEKDVEIGSISTASQQQSQLMQTCSRSPYKSSFVILTWPHHCTAEKASLPATRSCYLEISMTHLEQMLMEWYNLSTHADFRISCKSGTPQLHQPHMLEVVQHVRILHSQPITYPNTHRKQDTANHSTPNFHQTTEHTSLISIPQCFLVQIPNNLVNFWNASYTSIM